MLLRVTTQVDDGYISAAFSLTSASADGFPKGTAISISFIGE